LIPGFKTDITSPVLFYVGRILTGLGGGGFALAPPVYCSEITETSIRGAMGAMMQFMLTIGQDSKLLAPVSCFEKLV
jgi:MFS family permease